MSPENETKVPSLGELIRPLPGKIAVLVESKQEFVGGGIYIPVGIAKSVHEERPTYGKVVAVGEDASDDPDIKSEYYINVGDTVLFGKFSGTKIEWIHPVTRDREKVVIMLEREVLAIVLSPEQAAALKVKA